SVAMIPVAIALTVGLGPLLLGLAGALRARRAGGPDTRAAIPWSWTLTLGSALLYTLAFNLTFFIQELFLVLPKAFLPGVRPTLFHNNDDWVGENPLTSLFQGTGALAIFVSGIAFGFLLHRRAVRSSTLRQFIIWMAYHSLFQSLPQAPWGALNTGGDVGVAMHYLGLGPTAQLACALASMALIPPAALWLARHLLGVAGDASALATPGARTRPILQVDPLPARRRRGAAARVSSRAEARHSVLLADYEPDDTHGGASHRGHRAGASGARGARHLLRPGARIDYSAPQQSGHAIRGRRRASCVMKLTDFKVLTFDCYGTLIDWERGILAGLAPLVAKSRGPMSRDQILESFAREESAQEEETPAMLYSQLLGAVYKRLARSWGVAPSDDGANTF